MKGMMPMFEPKVFEGFKKPKVGKSVWIFQDVDVSVSSIMRI
jgi:hypothetical protein